MIENNKLGHSVVEEQKEEEKENVIKIKSEIIEKFETSPLGRFSKLTAISEFFPFEENYKKVVGRLSSA